MNSPTPEPIAVDAPVAHNPRCFYPGEKVNWPGADNKLHHGVIRFHYGRVAVFKNDHLVFYAEDEFMNIVGKDAELGTLTAS